MRAILLAAALASIATAGQARTLKELYSDDANALLAVDAETVRRDGAMVSAEVYFVLPAPNPATIGDKAVQVEDEVVQLQFDCAAGKVRSLGSRREDLTAVYPGEVGVKDWTSIDPGAPSSLVMAAVCADPPRLPDRSFATVADIAGPYRAAIKTRQPAADPAR